MKSELKTFQDNLNKFCEIIQGSFIESIDLYIDTDPTFDQQSVSFQFYYCHSVGIRSVNNYFLLHAAQTSEGLNSFWWETNRMEIKPTLSLEIEQTLIRVDIKNGIHNYPYRLTFDYGDKKIFLVCGEIYDTSSHNIFDYKINDEMIICFQDEKNILEFEKLVNYS